MDQETDQSRHDQYNVGITQHTVAKYTVEARTIKARHYMRRGMSCGRAHFKKLPSNSQVRILMSTLVMDLRRARRITQRAQADVDERNERDARREAVRTKATARAKQTMNKNTGPVQLCQGKPPPPTTDAAFTFHGGNQAEGIQHSSIPVHRQGLVPPSPVRQQNLSVVVVLVICSQTMSYYSGSKNCPNVWPLHDVWCMTLYHDIL